MSRELKRAVLVILAAMLVLTGGLAAFTVVYTHSMLDGLRLEIAARLGSMENGFAALGAEVKGSLRVEDSLLAGYSCERDSVSDEEQQISYVLRATPSRYEEGTQVSFLYTADGQAQRRAVGMREGPGYDFSTVIVLPANTERLEVYVAMEKDGVVQMQLADILDDLQAERG